VKVSNVVKAASKAQQQPVVVKVKTAKLDAVSNCQNESDEVAARRKSFCGVPVANKRPLSKANENTMNNKAPLTKSHVDAHSENHVATKTVAGVKRTFSASGSKSNGAVHTKANNL